MKVLNRINKRLTAIFSSSYQLATARTFESYSKQTSALCEYVSLEGKRITKVAPLSYIDEEQSQPYDYQLSKAYYAVVKNGSIIGGSGMVITHDGCLLHDALAMPDDENINITDNGLLMLFGKPHKLFGKHIVCHERGKEVSYNKGISLVWNMSSNYYHFTFEAAAKMYLVEQAELDRTIPLLVDKRVLNVPQMREIVDALNVGHRKVIPIERGVLCHVDYLYCFCPVNKILCNRKYGRGYSPKVEDFAYDPAFVGFYKDRIKYYSNNKNSMFVTIPDRVYLTRRECRDRKCNEEDIMPILEQYGFTVMQTEKMTLSDQYRLFSKAKHIIGTSGAAFTNMVFGGANSRYLIFVSFRARNTCYSNLSTCIGSECDFLAGESLQNDNNRVNEHRTFYYINPAVLKRYLQCIYG